MPTQREHRGRRGTGARPGGNGALTESAIGRRRAAARREASPDYLRRRQELLDAATVVFHRKGLAEATLGDVALEAGTDRASLYYYVSNKHELFVEVLRESMVAAEAIATSIGEEDLSPVEKLTKLVETSLTEYDAHYPYLYIYAHEDLSKLEVDQDWQVELAGYGERIFAIYRQVVAEGLEDGSFVSDLTPGVLAQILVGTAAWSHRWYTPGKGPGPEATGRSLAKLMLQGLAAGGPGAPSAPRSKPRGRRA